MEPTPTPQLLGRPLNDVEERFAPAELYTAGDASLLSPAHARVSVVGSRKASAEGIRRAKKLARILSEAGVVVVSGLARGIDTAAHRATIAAGGRTVAALGTGVDQFYPPENRELQLEIAAEHLVVSQFAPGSAPTKKAFPQRNRLMALISDATVIVEAGEGSGTLSQGWEAIRLGRPLFLLPSLLDTGLRWPDEMVAYGARFLEEGGEDLLELVPSPSREPEAVAF